MASSLSSVSLSSRRIELLHALGAELPLLLVARGESETPIVPTLADLELPLLMEEACVFVITGRTLPEMLRVISCIRRIVHIKLQHCNVETSPHNRVLECYIEQRNGRERGMHTMCLKAISSDLFESVLPNPEMSVEDLLVGSPRLGR